MKNILTTIALISLSLFALGQVPGKINYQAVARDSSGEIMINQELSFEIRILQGHAEGSEVFSETHETVSNDHGLVHIQIGKTEDLHHINWAEDIYFLEVSLNGEIIGTVQLVSVPYALHAETSADAFSGDYDDLSNKPEGEQPGDIMYWDGADWLAIAPGQHGQQLTLCNGIPVWGPCDDDNGDQVEDYDGNVYQTVVIGEKEWFAENLRSEHDADGQPISGAFAPDQNESMVEPYGKLYTWEAAMNGENSDNANPGTVQGICPNGWRIPSDAEMMYLANYLGGFSNAGEHLKSTRTVPQEHPRWNSPNSGANNQSGFTGYPAGRINADGSSIGLGTGGYFWTSTEDDAANAFGYLLFYNLTGFYKDSGTKDFAFSIRCVRDVNRQP